MTREERIEHTVHVIMQECNICGLPADEIAQQLARQHRTLQQAFMKLCVAFIKEEAKAESWDARNENAVKFAKEVVAKVHPDSLIMPFI